VSNTTRQRSFHFKDIAPADPAVRRWGQWLPANRSFYGCFRRWLRDSGYSDSAIGIYGVAARQALGFLDRPYWTIDPAADLERALQHFLARPISPASKDGYRKGLKKLADYLRLRCHRPPAEKAVNWGYYLDPLPAWLAQHTRDFVAHCRRAWPAERRRERTTSLLSHLTCFPRWAAAQRPLQRIADLDPQAWFPYLDQRLEAGIRPVSLNSELRLLQQFLRFLSEAGPSASAPCSCSP
jgi:hypothetical protein